MAIWNPYTGQYEDEVVVESIKPKFHINDRVRLNDTLKASFPHAYRYDLEYTVIRTTEVNNGHTNTIECDSLPEFIAHLHDSFLDLVTSGHKCTCDFHSVIMVVGCQCKGV